MDLLTWLRRLPGLGKSSTSGYDTEASIDLDVFSTHDDASKILVGVDLSRLERRNKERRATPHTAFGELHVEAGALTWTPQRTERACGVREIAFAREELRDIQRRTGAVIAVLVDGTNVPFVVPTQAATVGRRSLRPQAGHQEPPLIS